METPSFQRMACRIAFLSAFACLAAAPLPARAAATYVVAKGDTLSKIAGEFHVPVKRLKAANRLRSSRIAAGTELVIPARSAGAPGKGPAAGSKPSVADPLRYPTEEELKADACQAPAAGTDNAAGTLQARLIRVAETMLSIPYRWGGTTLRGIDCSGYVRKVYGFLNLDLPRSVREQFRLGEKVEKSDLSVGDLVFFHTYAKYPSHVGIYLGDNRFIHASSRSHEVKIDSLDRPYFVKRYIGAKRLLFEQNDVEN